MGRIVIRQVMLDRIQERRETWDILVIGGGATGAGIAVDAASRGYSVVLVEKHDFASGTSSRSTKLVHGGVRYLQQGNVPLVMDALRERTRLLQNAPHLVRDLAFVLPCYSWWEPPFYGLGLQAYDLLAGRSPFGRSRYLNRRETLQRSPGLQSDSLRGSIVYHDGQFDDARLVINLLQTAVEHGATVLNYAPVIELRSAEGRISGAVVHDLEQNRELSISARVTINATGAFCDDIRRMHQPDTPPLVTPSQGSHLVLDRSFLPGQDAMIVPRTRDRRVMFAIPWYHRLVVGTTDIPLKQTCSDPQASQEEIDFILETASGYLARKPTRQDVLATFAGIRPLVKSGNAATSKISRDHTIRIEAGLMTVTGGKWTTYRQMSEDAVNRAIDLGLPRRPCVTAHLPIHGWIAEPIAGPLSQYGSDAPAIRQLQRDQPELAQVLHPDLPYTGAEVVHAIRHEMARTVDDILARRLRAQFLDANASKLLEEKVRLYL